MMKYISTFIILFAVSVNGFATSIHHQISTVIDPEKHSIEVEDKITIPIDQIGDTLTFILTDDLTVSSVTDGISIELLEKNIKAEDVGMDQEDQGLTSKISKNKYAVKFAKKIESDSEFILKFSGKIFHPIEQMSSEYARGFSQTPGIIEDRGVYLAGSTYWIPWFNDNMISFELTTSLPEDWDVVSQGKRIRHEKKNNRRITTWDSPDLMEEAFLIAARFHEYKYIVGTVDVMAFLRTADENLANKYLETTAQYLEMYRKLIGPYPFNKFALVENFWETGYGMPSFTLLGEKIIRFPFILHSSYPHELLHNYWGNSVYVDFKSGNWCEGLTAYMADHLIKEQRGQGDEYRRSTLQRYTDYVNIENEFALNQFSSRYNAASEAIGYGKCLMVWDMLREQVGDEIFVRSFQKFYRENKFKRASFNDIKHVFESITDKNLHSFFEQWIDRAGAPELKISNAEIEQKGKNYHLTFTLSQIQQQAAFELSIPVAVSFSDTTEIHKVKMLQKEQSFDLIFAKPPLLLQVDPQFHVFRKLHHNEIPPSLSKIFGSDEVLIILPTAASKEKLESYKQLAAIWSKDVTKNIKTLSDKDIAELPQDAAVWICGLNNCFAGIIEDGVKEYDTEVGSHSIRFTQTSLDITNNSFIITIRHPQNPNSVAVWLTIDNQDAVQGLARKLPHYGKYSYLAFEGTEPSNIAKGQWPTVNSPLVINISSSNDQSIEYYKLGLPKRPALATLAPVFNAERMLEFVSFLASEDLQGRGPGSEGIDKAAQFIAENFEKAGLHPGADDGSYFQVWDEVVDEKGNKARVKNVIAMIPGINKKLEGQSVVVSAHYDHLGYGWPDSYKGNKGKIHFGADDNASGVAVLLELANLLGKSLKPQRTIIFAAFTSEESGLLGSKHYVQNTKNFPANKIIGVLNLDTVGRLGDKKLFVLNSSSAREWKFIFMGASYVTGVESEMITQDLDASDQVSFIAAGIPAVQFFSGAHEDYHRPSDTVDKIDASGMVKVASFVREGVVYLADREAPLTFMGPKSEQNRKPGKPGERRVTTGSMPDFSFAGKGVRIADLASDSPAAKAGLRRNDVIIQLGEFLVSNLREYSDALKSFNPGDEVVLKFIRDGKESSTKIILIAR